MWIVFLVSYFSDAHLGTFGILPRSVYGIPGIFFSPLIHADFTHLISNTFPLFILGTGIFYFYPNAAYKSLMLIYLITGTLVWIFARQVFHIGASGVIYGFVAYIFFSGLIRRDSKSIALSLLVVFLYGGLIWGILPGNRGISWESHLFGSVAGIISAVVFRKSDPPKKRYDWETEEDSVPPDKLEISYDADKNNF
ncbi:MAG: rhomboid family intramembrane serine protease [Ignavibacteriaceae bacterium]|nr:rhomboid family intramembrane serine protease [Ignavibacteriaceae bacterium]